MGGREGPLWRHITYKALQGHPAQPTLGLPTCKMPLAAHARYFYSAKPSSITLLVLLVHKHQAGVAVL